MPNGTDYCSTLEFYCSFLFFSVISPT